MRTVKTLLCLILSLTIIRTSAQKGAIQSFEFFNGTFNLPTDTSILADFSVELSAAAIDRFYQKVNSGNYQPIITALSNYRKQHQLDDWLFYQLIRKIAQTISPKSDNYERYTLYKWFFLLKSGYDTRLAIEKNKLLFYVRSNDDVSDIPYYINEKKKYVSLNIHDYPPADYSRNIAFTPVSITIPQAVKSFSYKITVMPDFKPESYTEKDLRFRWQKKDYHFKISVNREVQTLFANYPVVDFESYFNIPLSRETYESLIPALKANVRKMHQKKGIDYLMRFTRYAFGYQNDENNFGKERRLSPEQTLWSEYSDCDDRAALFFYLVKEIYNLPMITLLYPAHITLAIQLDKPVGTTIEYNGKRYSVCEPTPQLTDLGVGQVSELHRDAPYQIVYHYNPRR